MKRTEHEDRAIDALITKSLLPPMDASEVSDEDIATFLNDNTELTAAETEMLRRIDPASRKQREQSNGPEDVLQFPGAWQRDDELQIMAAARGQDEDITDEATRKAIAEKRRQAIERARRKRQLNQEDHD